MARKKKDTTEDVGSFPRKWRTKLPDGFSEEAESFSTDDLKKKVVEWEQVISGAEKDMANDEALIALKEECKEQSQVYKETMNSHQAKIRFAIYLLESRGAA